MNEVIPYQPDADTIDWRIALRRAKHAIVHHWLLIVVSCLVSVSLLVMYMRVFPPIYQAEAVLMGEANEDSARGQYYSQWSVFRKGDLKAEPELITSGIVARKVVAALDLKFDDVHHSFGTHVGYLWTESWMGKKYRAFKEWFSPPNPSAYKATESEIEVARTVDALKDSVSVETVAGTAIGRVVVKAPTYRAGEIANKIVEVYLSERASLFLTEAETAYKSLEEEVWRASADLVELDKRKFEFETKNKVVLDFEKDKLQVAAWASLKTSIDEAQASVASIEASLKVVEQQLASEPREVVQARTLQDSTVKGMLQTRLFQLSTSLQQDRERFVPNSPEVVQLEKFVTEARGALAEQSEKVETGQQRMINPVFTELHQKRNNLVSQLASARATLAAKKGPLIELEKRMDQMPGLIKTVLEQNRVRDGLELRYKLLRDRMMQADVSRSTSGSAPASVRVIDFASIPMKPVWPKNVVLFPATLGSGLLMGFVLAVLAELFSSRVNRDRLASRRDIPLYAVVNLRTETPSSTAGSDLRDTRPIAQRLRKTS